MKGGISKHDDCFKARFAENSTQGIVLFCKREIAETKDLIHEGIATHLYGILICYDDTAGNHRPDRSSLSKRQSLEPHIKKE